VQRALLTDRDIIRALYDFKARQSDEISFKKGDRMEVISKGSESHALLFGHQTENHFKPADTSLSPIDLEYRSHCLYADFNKSPKLATCKIRHVVRSICRKWQSTYRIMHVAEVIEMQKLSGL
jgi:SH3 domain